MGKNVEDEQVAAGRWLPVEEELLATCYVAVSEDNNVGRSQKHETFWYWVLNEFNSKNFQKRTKDMLTSKCHTLNANCQKFNAAYKRAKRLGKSGENDVDVMKRAQSIYRDEHKGVAFCQEDAWAILKFHPKWEAPEQVDLTEDIPRATQDDLFGHDARPRPAATGTKDLDDDDAYWIKKQKRLIKNKMRNDLGDEDDEDDMHDEGSGLLIASRRIETRKTFKAMQNYFTLERSTGIAGVTKATSGPEAITKEQCLLRRCLVRNQYLEHEDNFDPEDKV
nr:hypothetical protein [Tanacetum cinerariifolium]